MAGSVTVNQLVSLSRASLLYDDLLPVFDAHDFTQSPQGSLKQISVTNLFTTPTFTGLITGTAGITVAGALAGATTGAFSSSVTVNQLLIAAAVSRVVGGATSLSLRNNANTVDNLLLTDAGAATFRSTVSGITTLTATTVTATTLGGTLSTAAQPNITSVGTLTSLTASGNAVIGGYADVAGTVRATGTGVPTSGAGAEMHYGTFADFLGFDRSGSVYLPVRLIGSTLSLLIGASSNGLTFATSGAATFTNAVTVTTGGITVTAGGASITGATSLSSTLSVGSLTTTNKLKGGSSAPTVTKLSGSATFTVATTPGSNDLFGQVVITVTGSGSWAVKVAYSSAWAQAPFPTISQSLGPSAAGNLFPAGLSTYNEATDAFYASSTSFSSTGTFIFNYSVGG